MVDKITTQKRTNQYGGNYSSDEYNARVEENYQDLVYLYNKYNLIDKKINDYYKKLIMFDFKILTRSLYINCLIIYFHTQGLLKEKG